MLFERKIRTRTEPMRRGEGFFDFFDTCALEGYDEYRALVNSWIALLPAKDQPPYVANMRGCTNLQYQACIAELMTLAVLRARGHSIEKEPTIAGTSYKPDYRAHDEKDTTLGYVEVTTFGPAANFVAQSNRDVALYNGIDRMQLPLGWRVGIDIINHGVQQKGISKLRRDIQDWAYKVAKDQTKRHECVFDWNDWKVEITLYGGFPDKERSPHAIALEMGDVRELAPATEIRDALDTKGSKYGAFNAPYVVVIADCKSELAGGEHNLRALDEALFGTFVMQSSKDQFGNVTWEEVRQPDGYFGAPSSPKHQGVSAVVILPSTDVWKLRSQRDQAIIIHNPNATHPLSKEFMPLPGGEFTQQNIVRPIDGTSLADTIKVPNPWPPEPTRWLQGRRFPLFCGIGPLVWGAVELPIEQSFRGFSWPSILTSLDAVLLSYIAWLPAGIALAFLDRALERRLFLGSVRTQLMGLLGFGVTTLLMLPWSMVDALEPGKFLLLSAAAGFIAASACAHVNQFGIPRL